MFCHDVPRACNLASVQKERPLPREWLLWTTDLSEAHRWTAAGTVVWKAGSSTGLHRLFLSLRESRSVNVGSDSFTTVCVKRQQWKTVLRLNYGLFRPSPDLNQLFSYSEWIPEFPPWTDVLLLMVVGRLRFCWKCQRKISGEWIEKVRISEIFPFTGTLIFLVCTSFVSSSTVGSKKSRRYKVAVIFVFPCKSHLFSALFKSRSWSLLHAIPELHFVLPPQTHKKVKPWTCLHQSVFYWSPSESSLDNASGFGECAPSGAPYQR